MGRRVVIVGGVAGGMSCAARIKRLEDTAEVVVFERGKDVSYANCGMPYYIGGVIKNRADILVQTAAGLRERYGLNVQPRHEVIAINRDKKSVTVRNLDTGEVSTAHYDVLVLSPGAAPVRLPVPGADSGNVFVLNNLQDMDAIAAAADSAKTVCVAGAGFIGLELVENLRHRGLQVTLVELLDQVLPPLDREMTQLLLQELRLNGVEVILQDRVTAIEGADVFLASGRKAPADLVCISVGVRPNTELARACGLDLGPRGHIRVNSRMQTSDADIYAVGDAVEVRDFVTGEPAVVPLAGPANRQGRIAADNICGRDSAYRDTQGTAIVKVFNQAAAMTGLNEKRLKQSAMKYHRVYLHPMHRPRYYPGAQPIGVKLLFGPDGAIYGAQVVGTAGVESTINVLAAAMRAGVNVTDLQHMELAYSPQWGGAKHPINMVGYTAANVLSGDVEIVDADEDAQDIFWLDCRSEAEAESGVVPGAKVIPLDQLRKRVDELPRNREIGIYCAVGLRGYIGYRYLKQKGYRVRNLNGGYRTWQWFHPQHAEDKVRTACCGDGASRAPHAVNLDCSGMQCPGPLVRVKEAMATLQAGQILEVTATDPGFTSDIPVWCRHTGNQLMEVGARQGGYYARIRKTEGETAPRLETAANAGTSKTIICFSDDLDRALAAFIIANGAAAMGSEVTLFFTFWGLNVLRKESAPPVKKSRLDRMFGMMMPKGPRRLKLSKLNMAGMGTSLMKRAMKRKNVMSLPDLIARAQASGVKLVACSMSMDVMGIKQDELMDGVEIAGVGAYLGRADKANVNLFI